MLERSLRLQGAEEGAIAAVLSLHATAKYVIESGGRSSNIHTMRGIRQGCRLAPALWAILSAQLLQNLQNHIGPHAALPFTDFADDTLGHWLINGLEELQIAQQQAALFLQLLQQYGLKLNEDKSKILFKFSGRCAAQATRSRITMRKEVKCWTIPTAAHVFKIPIAAEIQYLGVVISVRRLRIWQTCVLTSALHGLHALKLGGPDALKLSQWFHRQVRAN